MKRLCILLIILSIPYITFSQCECTDCSIAIPSNTTQSSFLDISGATNNTLGQNGQQVCQICIELFHDAIEEFNMELIAPDGSSVDLMIDSGISVNDGITFNICFVSCDQSADPDAGFPAVFDTGAGWADGETYEGVYYPTNGCLEDDLSGSVNGEWELQMTDNVGLDDGILNDWYLVFTDDSGLNCANGDQCDISVSCIAEGGELTSEAFLFCEGDSGLQIDENPDFPNGNEPPTSEYTYTYLIVNADNGIIEDINENTDLTAYPPGNYEICGLSFLNEDETLIPDADGSLTAADIQDDIDNEEYCADLSDNCFSVIIEEAPEAPDFVGPATACPDELVTYEILNYDPNQSYFYIINGSFAGFIESSPGVVEITWLSGPSELCAVVESSCGDIATCVTTDIVDQPEIEIIGNLTPCPGSTEVYEFQPVPGSGESYNYTVTGGTITNQTLNTVEVEWPDIEDEYELCAELIGGACTFEPFCTDIEVELDYTLPSTLDSPDELCDLDIGTSLIPGDPAIISYTWTSTNLNIISGEGTNEVTYEGINIGPAEICLEIETNCSIQGPVCETIDILLQPDPAIQDINPTCELTILLESTADSSNEIEWTQESGPSPADIIDDDQAVTSVEIFTPGEYTFQITEINGDCESTAFVVVEILDELEVSDPIFECNLNNEYTVSFEINSGDAPYTINGDEISGNTFTSDFIPSEDSEIFTVIDDIGCSTSFEVEFECPCVSDAGTMSNRTIFICIEEEDFFEAEFDDNAFLDNNDIGLYYLHDGDDDELGEIFDISLDGEFEYFDIYELGVPYFISYVVGNDAGGEVDLDDECLSVAEGQEVIFLGTEPIDLIFDETVCGNTITIEGELSDIIVDIVWNQVDGPGTSSFLNDEAIPTEITVSEPGDYSYEIEIENEACIYYQEIDIEFSQGPNIENITETCDGAGSAYQVSLNLSGTGPFSANQGQILNGNSFTSDPIPTGVPYTIEITDGNGCTQTITGNKLCDCLSDAGFLTGQSVNICIEDSVSVTVSDFNLDSDDNGLFILHDGEVNILGDILVYNLTGEFGFNNNLDTDSTYIINYLVGNTLLDSIDLMDVCLDLSNGIEVSWTDFPLVTAGEDQASCDSLFILNASPSTGFWRVIEAPMGGNGIIVNQDLSNSEFEADMPGLYTLEWSSSNGPCTASDQVQIEYYPTPTAINLNTFCLDNLNQYVLSFDIINGNGPFTVDGTLLTDNAFASNFLDVNSITDFEIISGDGCSTSISFGPVDCSCESDIGTFTNASFQLCSFEILNPNISNNDFNALPDQVLTYVLHDGDSNNIGNILTTSQGEDIPYESSYNFGITYYLTPVLSTELNGEIDFNDPCIQIGSGIPVIWNPSFDINIDESVDLCRGEALVLNLDLQVEYPIALSFLGDDGSTYDFTLISSGEVISFGNIIESINFTLVSADGNCINSSQGNINVNIIEEPEIELVQGLEVCNNADFGSELSLSQLLVQEFDGEWNTDIIPLENDIINFDGLSGGLYTISFSTEGFNLPCPGAIYQVEIQVNECDCPIFNNNNLNLCNSDDPINLSSFDTGGFEGSWNIVAVDGQQTIPTINNNIIDIEGAEEGTYDLSYSISDNAYPTSCNAIINIQIIIEEALTAGIANPTLSICEGDIQSIDLFDLIEGNDNNGVWNFNGQSVSNIIESNILATGENVFEYVIDASGLCPGDRIENIIELNSPPSFSINSDNVLCFGANDGQIEILIEDENGSLVNCYLNDLIQEDGKIITGLAPGTYEIYLENEFCISASEFIEITEPEPVFVSLGDDREINIEEEITIAAITNILGSDIEGISWTDLSQILQIDVLELRSTFAENSIIQIEITDSNGCIAIDQIEIRVIEEELNDIYIPNIMSLSSQDNNASFTIQNLTSDIAEVESFRIYDRWGNKVHELENIPPSNFGNVSWDGFFNGAPAEQGVYVYSIILTQVNGRKRIFAGDITLIR